MRSETPEGRRAHFAGERWQLVGRVAEINVEPAYPLASDDWPESLSRTARELALRLFGFEPAPLRGEFLRVVRGRLYARLPDLPWSLLPGFERPAGLDLTLWIRRALSVPQVVWSLVRLPRRMAALAASAPATFATLEAELARHPMDGIHHVPDADLVAVGLDLRGSRRFQTAWFDANTHNTYAAVVGDILIEALQEALASWCQDDGRLHVRLLGGVGGLRSTGATLALLELAKLARRTPALAERLGTTPGRGVDVLDDVAGCDAFVEQLARFLALYGHRGVGEGSGVAARWAERPASVLDLVRNLVKAEPSRGVAAVVEAHEEAVRVVLARLRWRPWRRAIFQWLLMRLREIIRIREDSKDLLVAHSFRLRRTALEAGRRLSKRGVIDEAEDSVLFLTRPELEEALAGSERANAESLSLLVAHRRRDWEEWRSEPLAVAVSESGAVLESAPTVSATTQDADTASGTVRGIPASPGSASGPACVVMNPNRSGLQVPPGGILLIPHADTAWTPLFPLAAAVVVETGSVLAHAAIVARELGVPCVVAVSGATTRWRDGEQLQVDGSRGTVGPSPSP